MKQFDIQRPENVFKRDERDAYFYLFLSGEEEPNGDDITLKKQTIVNELYCSRNGGCDNCPGFNDVKTVLSGTQVFTTRRFLVIKMK